MSVLEFVASVVRSLAWPTAVVVILLVLRKPLAALIPLLERLKFRGLELDFRKQVHEVAAEADEALPALPPQVAEPASDIEQLAQVSPRAAVVESWLSVETAASNALQRRLPSISPTDLKYQPRLAQSLRQANILSPKQLSLFDELRQLRNAAVHVPNLTLTPSTAMEYARTARRLVGLLQSSSE